MADIGWGKYYVRKYIKPKTDINENATDDMLNMEVAEKFRIARCLSPVGKAIIAQNQKDKKNAVQR